MGKSEHGRATDVASGPSTEAPAAGTADAAPSPAGPDTDDRWVRLRSWWRFYLVLFRFAPLFFAYARDRRRFLLFGGSRDVTAEKRIERAEFLLETLFELGPTFIKLGQILSTRPDALPKEYITVLSRLQDRVPPVPWDEVRPRIEAELGPVDEAFDDFDTEPISGASLGQVYTARCRGEKVAVKVLRPGIRELVEADLRVIQTLLPILVYTAPQGQAFTLENLADEFAATVREEMDYAHEAAMLDTVRENFADDPGVVIPGVVTDYSTGCVLTMEYVEGVKIDDVETLDAMGIDRSDLVRRLEETYIQMIVEDGVFHADPHPGNLAVTDDGAIVFYDFGMTGRLSPYVQDRLLDFYIAVANENIDELIDAFIEMGALDPDVDRELIRPMFELAIENFRGRDIDERQVRQIVGEFQTTMYQFPLRLPQDLALIVRVSTVLEGVAGSLDPDFDFIEIVSSYVKREGYAGKSREDLASEVLERTGDDLRQFARGLVSTPPKADRVLDRIERETLQLGVVVEDENDELDRLAARIVYGLLLGSGVISATLLFVFSDFVAAAVAGLGAGVVALLFVRSLRQRRGIRTTPQFTRHSLRQRE